MHNMLLGVGKRITEVILKTLTESEINYLSKLMKLIKVPHQISRLARPLKKRHIWKAKEWESFILYYSVPLFSLQIMKCGYYYLRVLYRYNLFNYLINDPF